MAISNLSISWQQNRASEYHFFFEQISEYHFFFEQMSDLDGRLGAEIAVPPVAIRGDVCLSQGRSLAARNLSDRQSWNRRRNTIRSDRKYCAFQACGRKSLGAGNC
jgi:hypothetical protein